MHHTRPKNLNLLTIHFPIPAITSILHRISGVALFVLIPMMLIGLEYSLTEAGFVQYHQWFNHPAIKFLVWLFLIPYCFHLVAGIRHLLMDIHIGTRLTTGRLSAQLTILISITLILLAGIWLW